MSHTEEKVMKARGELVQRRVTACEEGVRIFANDMSVEEFLNTLKHQNLIRIIMNKD